ncbi:MAG: triphosphoribosyl-dephospho-CoA synthase CitG [Firmicutes bacterium]|nr:triphosphoribosyl-dephospho-CoA synthase CitG [Bacillota bacterium]HXL03457.1 triphosphoribosyl-dephospho-CoA synthase [Bacillota bacterium]
MIGDVLRLSLILEASCAPAPGLVDIDSPGAHPDMDYETLTRSAVAIGPSLRTMADAGVHHTGRPCELLEKIRAIGLEAEARMYQATSGVNTHKGAVFSLGLVAASAGHLFARGGRLDPLGIAEGVKAMASGIVARDLIGLNQSGVDLDLLSHGERIYMKYGLTGARGEAEQGFPTVINHGLPALEKALKKGSSLNDAMVHSLISIMANLDDTCVVHRSSVEILEQVVKPRARTALAKGGMMTEDGRRSILLMDEEFASLGISPGGSGDLLAVTLALHFLSFLT